MGAEEVIQERNHSVRLPKVQPTRRSFINKTPTTVKSQIKTPPPHAAIRSVFHDLPSLDQLNSRQIQKVIQTVQGTLF